MPVNPGQNVDLLYDRPAATDADLIFGADYVPPRNDVAVQATLPLPARHRTGPSVNGKKSLQGMLGMR